MDIKKVHEKLLELVIQFDKICIDYRIQYTLHGGSMLGAIREHGFILWDDDIDIAMSRNEFHKLETVLVNNKDFYIFGDIKKQFRKKKDNSVWIDIFVCDYIGDALDRKKKLFFLTLLDIMYKDKNSIKLVDFKKYSLYKRIAYKIVYKVGKLFPRNFKVQRYQKISEFKYLGNKKYMHRSNDQFNGRYKVFPSEWMDEYIRVPFENIKLSIILKYDEMLSDCYGENYMIPIRDTRNQNVHDIVRNDMNL